jgi:hypothetical protein
VFLVDPAILVDLEFLEYPENLLCLEYLENL